MTAGVTENFFNPPRRDEGAAADLSCQVDNCCAGDDCPPEEHAGHHTAAEKLRAGLDYAVGDLWGDLVGWFAVGMLLAGLISALVPDDAVASYLGGGLSSMALMLVIGVPLYICATASTPIAAAMILKGVSPGTALVLSSRRTGRRTWPLYRCSWGSSAGGATVFYLLSISVVSVLCGLLLDAFYGFSGIFGAGDYRSGGGYLPLLDPAVGGSHPDRNIHSTPLPVAGEENGQVGTVNRFRRARQLRVLRRELFRRVGGGV